MGIELFYLRLWVYVLGPVSKHLAHIVLDAKKSGRFNHLSFPSLIKNFFEDYNRISEVSLLLLLLREFSHNNIIKL